MAEVINWYMTGENYAENVEVTQKFSDVKGVWTHGICTKRMKMEVHLQAKCQRGTMPSTSDLNSMILSSFDTGGGSIGDLKAPLRGLGSGQAYRYLSPLTNAKRRSNTVAVESIQAWNLITLPPNKWVLNAGRPFLDGYEDELLGVTLWSATFTSEAIRIMLASWAGSMTVNNFDAIWASLTN